VQKHYGNWVRHSLVEEASRRLALWLVKGGNIWLTSDDVAGKSHLLRAVLSECPQVQLLYPLSACLTAAEQVDVWLKAGKQRAYWALDLPAGKLPSALGFAVFHLIERAKDTNKALLISWRCQEKEMCPPELSSRLLMMDQVIASAPEKDEDLKRVLVSVLKTMQWDMKETVLPVLLQYVPRNLPDLLNAIQKLDVYSRENRVKINGAVALKILGIHD